MPTPMWVYAEIAAEHGVDAADADAVDLWYEEEMQHLSLEKRQAIFDRLLAHDGAEPSAVDRLAALARATS